MFQLNIKINNTSYSIGTVFIGPLWIEDKISAFRITKNYEISFVIKLNESLVKKDIDNPENFFNYVLAKLSNNLNQGTIELFSSNEGSLNLEEYSIEGIITINNIDAHILKLSIKPDSLRFILNKH